MEELQDSFSILRDVHLTDLLEYWLTALMIWSHFGLGMDNAWHISIFFLSWWGLNKAEHLDPVVGNLYICITH